MIAKKDFLSLHEYNKLVRAISNKIYLSPAMYLYEENDSVSEDLFRADRNSLIRHNYFIRLYKLAGCKKLDVKTLQIALTCLIAGSIHYVQTSKILHSNSSGGAVGTISFNVDLGSMNDMENPWVKKCVVLTGVPITPVNKFFRISGNRW